MKNFKIFLLCLLLIWLIPTAITAILVPMFHKPCPKPREPQLHTSREYVKIVDDNGEAMLRRLQIIASAKENLVLSTYYLADDDAGRDIMASLLAASQRGVHVRLLVDGVCAFTSGLQSSEAFQSLLSQENVEARIYNPVNLLMPWDENYRMHDKYLIADQQVYILGGRNTRNKSIGTYPGKQDADRDVLVYCEGADSSASQLLSYFDSVWNSGECKAPAKKPRKATMVSALLSRCESLFKANSQDLETIDFRSFLVPVQNVSLYVNPVHAGNKAPQLWTDLLYLMGQGRDIEVQTPYIILSHQMHDQFSGLNQDRSMKIITNAPETGANPMGCAELLNRKKHLLKTGFQLYEYAQDRSAHVKSVVIDDSYSLVGSFNFDMRSAYLDTETMLLIDSPEINRQLRETNAKYMSSSRSSAQGQPEVLGEYFPVPQMGRVQKILYAVLRAMIVPVRHLL